jgi:phospholipid transport system substrate-binding protein
VTPPAEHGQNSSNPVYTVLSTLLRSARAEEMPAPELVIRAAIAELRQAATDERKRAFAADTIHEILQPRLNTRLVTKIVLGKHWSETSDYQRAEFERLFIRFIAGFYAGEGLLDAFLPEGGITITYGKTVVKGKRALVRMNFHESENTYRIVFVMQDYDGVWKVIDIKTENFSVIATKRSEFGPYISQHGIGPIIDYLRREVQEF